MGRLTTHVLDTANGRPAAGITCSVRRIDPDSEILGTGVTNADGRCDAPLLEGAELVAGQYELIFHAGPYLRSGGQDRAFLDDIVIRFVIDSPAEHYHVPLLLSPFGYTTYRGS